MNALYSPYPHRESAPSREVDIQAKTSRHWLCVVEDEGGGGYKCMCDRETNFLHCNEKPIYVFLEMKLHGLVPTPTYMYLFCFR